MTISSSTIRVFYDGACPLCQREVQRYQMLMSPQNEEIDWVDISNDADALKEECINYDDAMRLIHIKDGSGVHQVGLEAMLTLWDKIPYYRVVSGLISKLPKTHPLLAKFYEFLAKHRMTFSGRRK
ncbi:thiol-disulfide oxidoreductase DCC family protein [Cocleimonas flava]|uniref:Putative DCC family thiol-disulfide oxidoreductase YuxK n=1 Tax=Cocleimonas flava TaxID=634765 RepID=A0A4R1F7E2_9GAMM|nr:DUF393 domain-containing protein [Cocleimonas flava]TCJ88544.1 putative DCC family thiol-disulfide oxidoreductase YuxK [Cocleimonas flava]